MAPAGLAVDLPQMRPATPAPSDISVLLADGHALFAEALQARLAREPDLRPVRVAVTAEQVRAQVRRGRPAVVVLDLAFAEENGLSLAGYVQEASPRSRIVMLADVDTLDPVLAALRRGVRGWLPKTVKPEQLVRAIRGVARGEAWLPADLLGRVLDAVLGGSDPDPLAVLTPREREVLQCLVDGSSRQQVAQRLQVSTHTIRTHTQNLLAKLGVHSTLEAVALALRHGLRASR